MTEKFSIKLVVLAAAVALILWWMLGRHEEPLATVTGSDSTATDSLSSRVQAIPVAKAYENEDGVVSGQISSSIKPSKELNARSNAELKRRFEKARKAMNETQYQSAIDQFENLTEDYPSVVEPYLNLASIHAELDDLEKAREILTRGIQANQKAGMLFDGLKKIHGAIAGAAYRRALNTNTENGLAQTSLPRVSTIVTRFDQNVELLALKSRLENEARSESLFNETQNKQIAELEEKLFEVEKNRDVTKLNFERDLEALKLQLSNQSQTLLTSQTAEREALARVVRAEEDAQRQVAQLKAELEAQKQTLGTTEAALSDVQDMVAKQSDELAQARLKITEQASIQKDLDTTKLALGQLRQENSDLKLVQMQASARAAQIAESEHRERVKLAAQKQTEEQQIKDLRSSQERAAIARLTSWASAWSAQDVDAYVGHYAENYSSSRSITRAQWLEQRQVRLTNKTFISVKVSSFMIKDLGRQFSITFDQHYQSNTVDDIVRKRLVFNKEGDDWANAKIVSERLVPKQNS